MFFHVVGYILRELARQLVPSRGRIPIWPYRPIYRLPPFQLKIGTAFASQDLFESAQFPRRPDHLPIYCALKRTFRTCERPGRHAERILIFIDIRQLVVAEVDRIRLQDPRASKEVW